MINKIIYLCIALILIAVGVHFFYIKPQACPSGYFKFTADEGKICVAKFEMKKGPEGEAISKAEDKPWVDITRSEAIAACKKNGEKYNLITNKLWTDIARDIAFEKSNWSSNVSHIGKLNIGYANDITGAPIEANSDDEQSCYLIKDEKCNLEKWNFKRRTHKLRAGQIIWDFSGNVSELVIEQFNNFPLTSEYTPYATADFQEEPFLSFGPKRNCDEITQHNDFCGFGSLHNPNVPKKVVVARGGSFIRGTDVAGIFAAEKVFVENDRDKKMGFRCTFVPLDGISTYKELERAIQKKFNI